MCPVMFFYSLQATHSLYVSDVSRVHAERSQAAGPVTWKCHRTQISGYGKASITQIQAQLFAYCRSEIKISEFVSLIHPNFSGNIS